MRKRAQFRKWRDAMEFSGMTVGILFLVEFVDWFFGGALDGLGILPRTLRGLAGILFSPALHRDAAHLLANAFPLFILLMLLFWDRKYHPERTLGWIWLGSGFGTWLIGRGGSIHIGASSIVYGLVTYLIASGWWMRRWRPVLVAILVLIFYGGIFYGVLPQDPGVSWEGHLSGAIVGLWVARQNHGK